MQQFMTPVQVKGHKAFWNICSIRQDLKFCFDYNRRSQMIPKNNGFKREMAMCIDSQNNYKQA